MLTLFINRMSTNKFDLNDLAPWIPRQYTKGQGNGPLKSAARECLTTSEIIRYTTGDHMRSDHSYQWKASLISIFDQIEKNNIERFIVQDNINGRQGTKLILIDIISDPVDPPYLGISYDRSSASGPIIPCRFAVSGDSKFHADTLRVVVQIQLGYGGHKSNPKTIGGNMNCIQAELGEIG